MDKNPPTAGKRLVDVLGTIDLEFWNTMFAKMNNLLKHIEDYKGPKMSIDDIEYRWVQNRIEYWNSEERVLIKEEMKVANKMWNKYNN